MEVSPSIELQILRDSEQSTLGLQRQYPAQDTFPTMTTYVPAMNDDPLQISDNSAALTKDTSFHEEKQSPEQYVAESLYRCSKLADSMLRELVAESLQYSVAQFTSYVRIVASFKPAIQRLLAYFPNPSQQVGPEVAKVFRPLLIDLTRIHDTIIAYETGAQQYKEAVASGLQISLSALNNSYADLMNLLSQARKLHFTLLQTDQNAPRMARADLQRLRFADEVDAWTAAFERCWCALGGGIYDLQTKASFA